MWLLLCIPIAQVLVGEAETSTVGTCLLTALPLFFLGRLGLRSTQVRKHDTRRIAEVVYVSEKLQEIEIGTARHFVVGLSIFVQNRMVDLEYTTFNTPPCVGTLAEVVVTSDGREMKIVSFGSQTRFTIFNSVTYEFLWTLPLSGAAFYLLNKW